jgi:hypothetical protein
MTDTQDTIKRITSYLCLGGTFNPELANHAVVRDLLIDCRYALAAYEWKPIETALKDGTAIWAWQPRLGNANKVFWSKHTNQWCYYGNNLKIRESSISHWQHLPLPPKE